MDSPTTSGTELDVADTCEMLVAVEDATVTAGMASLLVTTETPTETMSLESRADSLAARLGDVVEIGFSSVAAGRAPKMLMEGEVPFEPEVTEGLGVEDS